MILRNADEKDYKFCEKLESMSFIEPWDEKTICTLAKQSDFFHVIVAEENDNILGYAFYSNVLGSLELMRIAVSKDYRRKGIADRIIDYMFAEESKSCFEECFLEVRAGNFPAICLYEKHGFEKISVRKKYYSNGEDAIIFKVKSKR